MSDEADKAQDVIDRMNEQAALLRKPELHYMGFCHNCGEYVEAGRIFCCIDCRDDWQHEQDAKRRNGK